MPFSDLPPEIVHEILIAAVQVRSLGRAVRLRHVSRSWDAAVVRALFESGVLDDNERAYRYWPQYVAYRASQAGRRHGDRRPLLLLRRVAERLLAWRGHGGPPSEDALTECVGEICAWMVPEFANGVSETYMYGRYNSTDKDKNDEEHLLHALLAIAAARNDVALVEHSLRDVGNRPWLISDLSNVENSL
ncbi:hypothetical protein PG997_014895 [Apiospora hydei]|uniref:F-box domain-containing protein n=1 Tax=Apiospora hydei TaxID=1337664 RepID=A0ABR1UV53_9PEZI